MSDPSHQTELDLRASDEEREAASDELRRHYADGRITSDELSERMDAVFAARTRSELAQPLSDLPHDRRPTSPTASRAPARPAPRAALAAIAIVAVAAVTNAWWLLWLLWPLIHRTGASQRHRRRTVTGTSLRA